MRFPPEYWVWQRWVDSGSKPPPPPGLPKRIPLSWKARSLLHRPPKPQAPYSLFSELGGFVSQAGSFPPDTESARAFVAAGGRWLAVQFGDPKTDQGNRARFSEGWALRWRQAGVRVGAWWRVEHVGIPVPNTPPVDFLIPNPENADELERLPGILQFCRARTQAEHRNPDGPLAIITLGKIPGFPTGALEQYDVDLILECFLETPASDTSVTNSVRYWRSSSVALHRIKCCLLFKPGYDRYPVEGAAAEAKALGVHGLSSFTAENCPADAWKVMA